MSMANIKKLRELTSLGINDCKEALVKAKGDFDKALEILRKKGIEIIKKKSGRNTSQGIIDAYIHFGGNLGSLVEVNCETDFVARTEVFKKFVNDLAMQIAAADPKYINREEIPEEEIGKISNLDEFARQNCLLEQFFVKDNKMTIKDYMQEVLSQTGENIVIKRFSRFSLGI
ncbi:MAG: elongation factor Ts [Candidatus Omnitrophota bacterium]